MFEIGFWEMALIGVVAMIVVGPERLPGLARTAGLWLGKARRMVADVKAEVDRELHLEEIKQSLRQQAQLNEFEGIRRDLTEQAQAIQRDLQAEFDDPGPPPGWRSGDDVSAPPPADWSPPVADAAAAEARPAAPVSLEKTGTDRVVRLEKTPSPPPPAAP